MSLQPKDKIKLSFDDIELIKDSLTHTIVTSRNRDTRLPSQCLKLLRRLASTKWIEKEPKK
jgi:hypothetical protein